MTIETVYVAVHYFLKDFDKLVIKTNELWLSKSNPEHQNYKRHHNKNKYIHGRCNLVFQNLFTVTNRGVIHLNHTVDREIFSKVLLTLKVEDVNGNTTRIPQTATGIYKLLMFALEISVPKYNVIN